jgi:hypothetical protein
MNVLVMTLVAPMHTITDIHQQLMLTAVVLLLIMTAVVIIGFRLSNIAHGQVTPETITPQQKAIMCDPNNPKLHFVNSTESVVCGLPQSIKTNETTNTTTP